MRLVGYSSDEVMGRILVKEFITDKFKTWLYLKMLMNTVTPLTNWPQLRHAPIKFGWFIKLYNINVKVLYKQADMGFAAEAGLFLGGERVRFAPKKDVTLHPRATDFQEKRQFFGGGERGRFAQKKAVTLLPRATDFWEKKSLQAPYVL